MVLPVYLAQPAHPSTVMYPISMIKAIDPGRCSADRFNCWHCLTRNLLPHVVVSSSLPHVPLPVPGSLGVNSGQVADDPETFDKILDGWQT